MYYKDENISEKQNFLLDISDAVIESKDVDVKDNSNDDLENDADGFPDLSIEDDSFEDDALSAEDERRQRENPFRSENDINAHDTSYDELGEELNPDIMTEPDKYAEKSEEDKYQKQFSNKAEQKILEKINSLDNKTKAIFNTNSKLTETNDNGSVSFGKRDQFGTGNYPKQRNKEKIIHIIQDSDVKEKLYLEYKGFCQICSFTFVKSGRENSFEAFNWTDSRITKNANRKIIFANSLCLCRNCAANIKFGQFKSLFLKRKNSIENFNSENIEIIMQKLHKIIDDQIPEKFEVHIEFNDMYALEIELDNKKRNIYFTPKHYLEFILLMQGDK
ncbi:MAG: hypothetical protein U9Q62_11520 [Campylobacterota bacterium]|nr:hypothetical protein [Campylobacterota bacterium]